MGVTQAIIHTDSDDKYYLPFQPKSFKKLEEYLNEEQSKSNYLKCVKLTDDWPDNFLVPFEKISYVEFIQ